MKKGKKKIHNQRVITMTSHFNLEENFKLGEYYERLFANKLGVSNTITEGNFPDYDIETENGTTYEIKAEIGKWESTGKHFVEIWNINEEKPKPSGISTTKADFWVVALVKDKDVQEWIIVKTNDLKKLIKRNNYPFKKAKIDVWTKGAVVPLTDLRQLALGEE